ncbi:MAG: hypothetical protein ABFR05_02480 [Bacteroidota bacterium]
MIRKYFRIVILAVFLLTVGVVFAGGPPPPKPHPCPPNNPHCQVPIDGGIYVLLLLGTAFGVKKLWNKDK